MLNKGQSYLKLNILQISSESLPLSSPARKLTPLLQLCISVIDTTVHLYEYDRYWEVTLALTYYILCTPKSYLFISKIPLKPTLFPFHCHHASSSSHHTLTPFLLLSSKWSTCNPWILELKTQYFINLPQTFMFLFHTVSPV